MSAARRSMSASGRRSVRASRSARNCCAGLTAAAGAATGAPLRAAQAAASIASATSAACRAAPTCPTRPTRPRSPTDLLYNRVECLHRLVERRAIDDGDTGFAFGTSAEDALKVTHNTTGTLGQALTTSVVAAASNSRIIVSSETRAQSHINPKERAVWLCSPLRIG